VRDRKELRPVVASGTHVMDTLFDLSAGGPTDDACAVGARDNAPSDNNEPLRPMD
jgi:hypothetical protein